VPRVIRFSVAVALAVAALALGLPPTLAELGGRYGSIGVHGLSPDGTDTGPHDVFGQTVVVRSVEPGSPAANVGIVAGDRVARTDLYSMTSVTWRARLVSQLAQIYPTPLKAGIPIQFSIVHRGHRRFVEIVPRAVRPPLSEAIVDAVTTIYLFLGLSAGALLVLLRPSLMTWGLYASTVGWLAGCTVCQVFSGSAAYAAQPEFKPFVLALAILLGLSGDVGLVVFFVRFPTGSPVGRWRVAEAAAIPLIVSLDGIFALGVLAPGLYATPAGAVLERLGNFGSLIVQAIAAAAFLTRFVLSSGDARQRLRWAAIGIASLILSTFVFISVANSFLNNYEAFNWIALVATLINMLPFTVLYAVLRHRVIDVAFVLNRAVVFTLLAAIAVLLFGAADLYLSRNAAASRIELAVDVAIALILGFSFGASQRKLTEFVDAALFRRRYRRRRQMDELADRVYSLNSQAAMGAFLTKDLPEALDATSAALFERLDDGGYLRGASYGWAHDAAWHLLPDQAVVQRADAAAKPVSVDVHEWYDGNSLPEASRPAIAVPIVVAHRARALLLLGPHRNGADFDASEVGLLKSLAARVASVYGVLPRESPLAGALTA
jgi:hypothetical protein